MQEPVIYAFDTCCYDYVCKWMLGTYEIDSIDRNLVEMNQRWFIDHWFKTFLVFCTFNCCTCCCCCLLSGCKYFVRDMYLRSRKKILQVLDRLICRDPGEGFYTIQNFVNNNHHDNLDTGQRIINLKFHKTFSLNQIYYRTMMLL